jgi:UDP-N-acetylglucosamine acyltransferase
LGKIKNKMIKFKKIKENFVHHTAIINWKKVKIGKGNIIGPNVIIGTDAQHPYLDSKGEIIIGNNNTFREFTTVHLPTEIKKITKIGNNCYFMALSHIAHDCNIEDEVIFSNNVTLGGNTYVMTKSQIGFNSTIHQNQVIGSFSMIGMSSVITKKMKIIPGYIYAGNPAKRIALNKIGIKKKNISKIDLKKEKIRFTSIAKKHSLYKG